MKKILKIVFLILIILSVVFYALKPVIYPKIIEKEEENAAENMQPEISKEHSPEENKKYIKWMEFKVPYKVLAKTMAIDIKSYGEEVHYSWIELLAYLAAKNGGNIERVTEKDVNLLMEKHKDGKTTDELGKSLKYYEFYKEAYSAVLSGFLGEYTKNINNGDRETSKKQMYGLKVYSPIAKGYGYSHYDDFGTGRSYGYKRLHQGHDLMGSIGTPVVAIEDGTVEALGWNQYGGWRIGIRSDDKKRYYYYAHLRKDHPYHPDTVLGAKVKAGDVIGYLGMTGYSAKENVNNINTPHLHLGMEIIFDESQKDGVNQLWMDLYAITELLDKNKSFVVRNEQTKEYYSENQRVGQVE